MLSNTTPYAFSSRSGQCGFGCPSSSYSPSKNSQWYSDVMRPICDGHGNSGIAQDYVVSSISGLDVTCGPSAVVRRISLTVVATVDACALWARPHIFKERLKRVIPSVAYRNSPSSVMFPASSIGISASCFYCHPYAVFARLVKSCRCTMRCENISHRISLKTSARASVSRSKIAAAYDYCRTAFAAAVPSRLTAVRIRRSINDSKSTEEFSGNVNDSHRIRSYAARMIRKGRPASFSGFSDRRPSHAFSIAG